MRVLKFSVMAMILVGTFWLSLTTSHGQTDPIPSVQITTPDSEDHVPIGNLTIYGRSTDTAAMPCQVQVSMNDEFPMANATARGPRGADDFSQWMYTFDPYFALVKEGVNPIESQIICFQSGGNVTGWDSINVTGDPEALKSGNGTRG